MRQVVALGMLAIAIASCSGAPATAGGTTPAASSVAASEASSGSPSPSPVPTPMPTPTVPPGVTAVVDVEFVPSGIVTDDALLWAEDHARTQAVYAVDPDTGRTVATIEVTRPCDVVPAFGRIWVADLDGGTVLAVDPATHEVVSEIPNLHGPCGIQADTEAHGWPSTKGWPGSTARLAR